MLIFTSKVLSLIHDSLSIQIWDYEMIYEVSVPPEFEQLIIILRIQLIDIIRPLNSLFD